VLLASSTQVCLSHKHRGSSVRISFSSLLSQAVDATDGWKRGDIGRTTCHIAGFISMGRKVKAALTRKVHSWGRRHLSLTLLLPKAFCLAFAPQRSALKPLHNGLMKALEVRPKAPWRTQTICCTIHVGCGEMAARIASCASVSAPLAVLYRTTTHHHHQPLKQGGELTQRRSSLDWTCLWPVPPGRCTPTWLEIIDLVLGCLLLNDWSIRTSPKSPMAFAQRGTLLSNSGTGET
jgi:hypothetical protein